MSCACNKCIEDGFYDVIGLCDVDTTPLTTDLAWTEISIPEVLKIPCVKPDVEAVNKVFVKAKIISKRVVSTPDSLGAENAEGTKVTGKKLVVEVVLQQKIVYTALEREQSVHSAHFNIPFSAFIVLPTTATLDDEYCVETCIEDVYVKVLNDREIFKNVTLFLRAKKIS